MHGSRILLELVIILGAAAVTTVLFSMFRLPVVLGYILAGLAIGPHVPVPVVANSALVNVLSELGVILLMFSIGLEFSIRSIARAGTATAATALFEVALLVALGFLVARLLGWTSTEGLFAGAAIAISSTMLVARALDQHRASGELRATVYALLVFEDLISIVLLAVLAAVASGRGLSSLELVLLLAKLGGFLLVLLAGGLLLVPRAIRHIAKRGQPETLLVTSLAICFAMAALAEHAGFSVALGAFVAGVLIAESGNSRQVDDLIRPFRDAFTAVFFVSVGMSIDPSKLAGQGEAVLALAALAIAGKTLGVTLGGFLTGQGVYRSVRASFALTQIGEYAFIAIAIGVRAGVVGEQLLPVLVAAACITAATAPWMMRRSDRAARWLDHHLPRPLATLVSLHEGWIASLGAKNRDTLWQRLRRPALVLLADAAAFTAIVIGIPTLGPELTAWLSGQTQLEPELAEALVIGGGTALASLFLLAVVRRTLRLAVLLSREVIPARPDGELDLGSAPRQALRWMLSLGLALLLGVPIAAITQPFVPASPAVIAALALFVGVSAWRAIRNLDGHVRAGSALIVEVLAAQTGAVAASHEPAPREALEQASLLLPGITELSPVELSAHSRAVGLSLAQLDLRARTGATVLALRRGGEATAQPSPHQPLCAGDVLALTGSAESVAHAIAELTAPAQPAEADASSGEGPG